MDTIKLNCDNVKMIAHRGVSGLERENTYPAFVAAGNRSYFGIECDVHVTLDGKFVIIHDKTTERVSLGATNIDVEQSLFDEIKDVQLPDLDGSYGRRDITIPSLEDYIKICKKYDKKCVLELKGRFKTEDIVKMIDEIEALDYLENVIFISFSYENCADLRALLPDATIQYLTSKMMSDEILDLLQASRLDLDISRRGINGEWIDRLHALGIKVNVWTCDDKEEAERLIEMGVDFITTNILE